MKSTSIEAIVQTLTDSEVRYLIVGGLAVVAHGYVRFTADLDLVLALDDANLGKAVAALSTLGYRPRAPVSFSAFVDPQTRAEWVREKGMVVFSIHSPSHPSTEIDLFLASPIDFEQAHARAARLEIAPGQRATFVSLPDLLEMKRLSGRPRDLEDIAFFESMDRGEPQ